MSSPLPLPLPRCRYFFKADSVHEVPGFVGHLCRINMACFIGYSQHDDEIMVWG